MRNALRAIARDLRSQSTARPERSRETPVFDSDSLQEIQEILDVCGTHMASISVSVGTGGTWTQHEVKTMFKTGSSSHPDRQLVPEGEEILPIASITKILVAVAVIMAIEGDPLENAETDLWAKFRGMGREPLSKLYNLSKQSKMGALPENPWFYDLVVHHKSLPSMNHHLLSPTGEPMVMLSQLLDEVLGPISLTQQTTSATGDRSEPVYSNINYSTIAMVIEALWDGTFEDFMHKTLFGPLGMRSTSIGFPANSTLESYGWVVDSNGKERRILRPKYRPDGAEAAALGAYSTVHDLDKFFKFISDTFSGKSVIAGVGQNFARTLLQLENKATKYRPLGLLAELHTSDVGSMSMNREQFLTAHFSTYPILPSKPKEILTTYYMAGTALGCSCATAFNPYDFPHTIVVLTDTSGPVDTADHILRFILRRLSYRHGVNILPQKLMEPESVVREAETAMTETIRDWGKIMLEDLKLIEKALVVDKDVVGVYKGDGFSQWLDITRADDTNIRITVRGPVRNPAFVELQLVWIDKDRVKICAPPDLAVDTLGTSDWSNLVLEARGQDRFVGELVRRTASGEDRYLRQA